MKTNAEWRLWGDRDPLWGVASWEGRDKSGSHPWTDAEFYALGDDWQDFRDHWVRYGLRTGSVLEIGCGAGRITNRLAQDFARVTATDVSEGMLRYARERVLGANIEWKMSNGSTLPAEGNSLDAVFSCHVLQHFQSNGAQLDCFAEMRRVLMPGGTLLVHLPIHQFPAPNGRFVKAARLAYTSFKAFGTARAAIKRAAMRAGGKLYMHGISIEQGALYAGLTEMGFDRVEFGTFPVRTNGSLHSVVLATKA